MQNFLNNLKQEKDETTNFNDFLIINSNNKKFIFFLHLLSHRLLDLINGTNFLNFERAKAISDNNICFVGEENIGCLENKKKYMVQQFVECSIAPFFVEEYLNSKNIYPLKIQETELKNKQNENKKKNNFFKILFF